jgi:hypothetical protein
MECLERRIAATPYDIEAHEHAPLLEVVKELDQATGFVKDILQADKLSSSSYYSSSWGGID